MRAQPIRSYLIRLRESLVSRLCSPVSAFSSRLSSLCPFPIVSFRTKCRILGLEVGAGEARSPCVLGRISLRLRFCLHERVSDGCWSVVSLVIV